MDKMREFSESTGFIFSFLIGTLFLGMILGERVQRYFLILVLTSMLIANASKFRDFINKI